MSNEDFLAALLNTLDEFHQFILDNGGVTETYDYTTLGLAEYLEFERGVKRRPLI